MAKFLTFLLFALPAMAYANMVWPALYLETRLFSWWAITLGLVVEYLFVRSLLSTSILTSIYATVVANFVSAVAGILLIPLLGIIWEIFPGLILYYVFEVGTFNPFTWGGTFLIACASNVILEGLVYARLFQFRFKYKSKLFFWFMVANMASVGAAMASLFIYPIKG